MRILEDNMEANASLEKLTGGEKAFWEVGLPRLKHVYSFGDSDEENEKVCSFIRENGERGLKRRIVRVLESMDERDYNDFCGNFRKYRGSLVGNTLLNGEMETFGRVVDELPNLTMIEEGRTKLLETQFGVPKYFNISGIFITLGVAACAAAIGREVVKYYIGDSYLTYLAAAAGGYFGTIAGLFPGVSLVKGAENYFEKKKKAAIDFQKDIARQEFKMWIDEYVEKYKGKEEKKN